MLDVIFFILLCQNAPSENAFYKIHFYVNLVKLFNGIDMSGGYISGVWGLVFSSGQLYWWRHGIKKICFINRYPLVQLIGNGLKLSSTDLLSRVKVFIRLFP
ncbi:hypothetical protein PN36_24010 [Candidatus Thiomargarita nelsonii]|uniref:Uncharacterized protein n=1 Tax=Candidatus Thiomargarita nelsonii TaxID=1003181 RepID=A0A0A6PA54_9GAMM|nr:hypothetical protein PN36_24010 [Candidatus Thiomargarita nelsonii]